MIDLKTQAAELAANLKSDTPGLWGIMQAHHMIEHLAMSVRISNGRLSLKQAAVWDTFTEEQKQARRERLLSDLEFDQNLKNPILPTNEPSKLRKEKFEESLAWFLDEVKTFHKFWAANPDHTLLHPVYGPLIKNDWEQFHRKHIYHHYKQFSLIK